MGLTWLEQQIEIDADAERCFAAITDYETFHGWQGPVKSAKVLERDPDGLGHVVEFRIDGVIRELGYTLAYSYERPHRVTWDLLSGDLLSKLDGEYRFDESGAGVTAVYRLGVEIKLPVPRVVAKRLGEGGMKASLQGLKERVEG